MNFSQNLTPYSPLGRSNIHKNLSESIASELSKVVASPIPDDTIEFNDNRISKWVSQKGKCFISNVYLGVIFDCHHILPRSLSGTDRFYNLVILDPPLHSLLHNSNLETVRESLKVYNLTPEGLAKFNVLRTKADMEPLVE